MSNEKPQEILKRETGEYMYQTGENIEKVAREKQKMLEALENTPADDDLRRETLKTTITHLDKTIELIGSVSRRACELIAWEDEKS